MGTHLRIALYAPDEVTAKRAAESVFDRVRYVEERISSWDPESELSRLLAAKHRDPVKVSPDLWWALRMGYVASHNSGGAYDITAGPLIRLWRRARADGRLPTDEERELALRRVGFERITLYEDTKEVLIEPGTEIDFGSLGKGHAIGALWLTLHEFGVRSYLVDFGGDIAVGEPPPGQPGWRIAVPGLNAPVTVHGASICTSGHTAQHVEIDGRRYSHILDARDGRALTNGLQVTVISAGGTRADALATILSILGPDEAEDVLDGSPSVALIQRDGAVIWKSPHWPDWRAASREIR